MPPVLSTLRPLLHPSTHHAPDVRIKLTHANYFAWRIEVFEGLGSFGLSGEEIRLDKKYEFEELCRTTRYKVDMKDPDTGVVEQVEYEWDESAERSFLAKESRQQMQKDHKVDTDGKLWLWIALSIDTNILDKLRNQKTYATLQATKDCLGFWNLIFEVVVNGSFGANAPGNNRMKWQSLAMYDKISKRNIRTLAEYIHEFNGYVLLLKGSSSEPTEHDQSAQFVNGLHPIRFSTYITKIIGDGNVYPSLADIQDTVTRIDAHLESHDPASDRDPSVALMTRVGGKRRREDAHERSDNKRPAGRVCANCGEEGHRTSDCTQPKVQCDFCDNFGHMGLYCFKRIRAKKELLLEQKKTHKHRGGGGGGGSGKDNKKDKKKKPFKPRNDHQGTESAAQATATVPSVNAITSGLQAAKIAQDTFAPRYEGWNDVDHLMNVQIPGPQQDGTHTAFMAHPVQHARLSIMPDQDVILIDSGASIHVFRSAETVTGYIENWVPPPSAGIVGIGGVFLPASARGYIPKCGRFYVVPSAHANLLSVSEFAQHSDYQVTFVGNACEIMARSPSASELSLIPPLTVEWSRAHNAYPISAGQLNQLLRLTALAYAAKVEEGIEYEVALPAVDQVPEFSREQRARARQERRSLQPM